MTHEIRKGKDEWAELGPAEGVEELSAVAYAARLAAEDVTLAAEVRLLLAQGDSGDTAAALDAQDGSSGADGEG